MSLLGWSGLDRNSWLEAVKSSARIIILGLVCIVLAWAILRIASPGTDHDVALALYNTGANETIAQIWWVIASVGDLAWVPLIFWLYVFRNNKHEWTSAAVLAVAMVAALAATDILKLAFHLPRPFTEYRCPAGNAVDCFVPRLEQPTNYAYPSGHATNAFTVATIIWARYKPWRIPFLALGLGTGIGVVVLGLHFLSDVVGGAFLGMLSASFALSMARLRSADATVTS